MEEITQALTNSETAIYGLTWWTMSMMVAGIAQGKGRSGLNWWLLSIVVSPPVALSILVIFYPNIIRIRAGNGVPGGE